GSDAFNDKESLTADPTDPTGRRVYVVWDRLEGVGLPAQGAAASPVPLLPAKGPLWLARTLDGGATWEPGRPIYDPGPGAQTIGNQVVVLPDGTLLDGFAFGRGVAEQDAGGVRAVGAGGSDGSPDLPVDLPLDPEAQSASTTFSVAVSRSTDHGATWSAPVVVGEMRPAENSARLRAGQVLPDFAVDHRTG